MQLTFEKDYAFEDKAHGIILGRGESGMGDQYVELQPTSIPEINHKPVVTRTDVCFM